MSPKLKTINGVGVSRCPERNKRDLCLKYFKASSCLFMWYKWICGYSATREWYTTICLPEVFEEIRKDNRRRRIFLHHDNAGCHRSAETTRFLEGQKTKLMDHPPYSLDLARNHFYLFSNVKNKLRSQRFLSREEAVDAF
ncbi:Histone-lysine N-methyltransferase SETMAR [Eumeta japonica]|uniref:Histone-lysine N-methyltransferase SETMAR n=1 Tax=Eumeta variegata TaxID=151549 RepID=A0A4C1VKL7_EUMVA|nr:Histone-lysine N-methyltransferase SETMAR [Eumeta japonica]